MFRITSIGSTQTNAKSGIYFRDVMYPASIGLNIYGITDNSVISYDCAQNINPFDDPNNKYVVGLKNGSCETGQVKFVIDKISENFSTVLKSVKLSDKTSYYFLFDNQSKKLILENINNNSMLTLVCDYSTGKIISKKNKHIVCSKLCFKYFVEYIDSFKDKLGLNYIILDDVTNYNYINNRDELYIFCQSIEADLIDCSFNKVLLNTEQMTILARNTLMQNYISQNIKLIDYSIENQFILKNNSIYIPYQYDKNEIDMLKKLYSETPKTYDIAFTGATSERRTQILNELINKGYSVLNITDWGTTRDELIASCKVLINIHYGDDYQVYESIRCDRWSFALMPVISEDSVYTEHLDMKKHELVTFCRYNELVSTTCRVLNNLPCVFETNVQLVNEQRLTYLNNAVVRLG